MSAIKLVCLVCGQANRIPEGRRVEDAKCAGCGTFLVSGHPVATDPAILSKAVRLDDMPLLVDFWAPWCGPCRVMAPEFEKAAGLLRDRIRFAKLDTQDHPEAGRDWGIRGIPTLISFGSGKERGRRSGALPASQIAAFATGDPG